MGICPYDMLLADDVLVLSVKSCIDVINKHLNACINLEADRNSKVEDRTSQGFSADPRDINRLGPRLGFLHV